VRITRRRTGAARALSIATPVLAALSVCACNTNVSSQAPSGLAPSVQHSQAPRHFRRGGPTGETISVDLRPYRAALLAIDNPISGMMLCESIHEDHCRTSMKDTAGEAREYQSKGGAVNYEAIGSHDYPSINGSSTKRIGDIRNFTGPDSGNVLRCFSLPNHICMSPAEKALGPPYLIPYLPVVGVDALNDASNSDKSPSGPIAGSMIYTPDPSNGNYWNFGINTMTASGCVQTYYATDPSQGRTVYVKAVPFGGNVGTQDAIVDDGYSGHSTAKDHVERSFYVLGLGLVRFGVAYYDPSDGLYDNSPHYNQIWNDEQKLDPNDFNIEPAQCPQGSAVPLWPTTTQK
jgi:hypothetical protein